MIPESLDLCVKMLGVMLHHYGQSYLTQEGIDWFSDKVIKVEPMENGEFRFTLKDRE